MKVLTHFFIICTVMFWSCGRNEIVTNDSALKSPPRVRHKVKPKSAYFDWSKEFEVTDVIRLETARNSVINGITELIVKDSFIYIHDQKQNAILQFGLSGKFLKRIGSNGKGPGQYLEVRDFDILNDKLYALDYRRIHVYHSQSGRHIKTVRPHLNELSSFNPTNLHAVDDKRYFLFDTEPSHPDTEKEYYRMYLYRHDQPEVGYFRFDFYNGFDHHRFYRQYDGTTFLRPLDGYYDIYRLSSQSIENYIGLDFGSLTNEKEVLASLTQKNLNSYLKSPYYKGIHDVWLIPDGRMVFKVMGPKSFRYEGILDFEKGVVEFGSFDFPYSPCILFSNKDYLFGYYEPARIKRLIGKEVSNKFFEQLKPYLNGVRIEDNPIIVKIALKS